MTISKRASVCVGVTIVAVACSAFGGHVGQARTQVGDPYEIVATRNVMVAARDGVTLATDVYAPGRGGSVASGRFPTIVERTVYNKDSIAEVLNSYFVPRGYVVVMQDVRGRYRSEGTWRPIRDDGPDGADLLKWIAATAVVERQGRHRGYVVRRRDAARDRHHERSSLAAMVPVDAMSNAGQFGVRHNGAFELRWLNWIFTLGNATGHVPRPPGSRQRPTARWPPPGPRQPRRRFLPWRSWARACGTTRWRCRCGPGPRRSNLRRTMRTG